MKVILFVRGMNMDILTPEGRFQSCITAILEHEGGLTKDKRDPGGTTNWGVSLRYLKSMGLDLNSDGVINEQDIIGLHKDGAESIYRKYWWDAYNYSAFNEILVVEKVFDLAVNMGSMAAHKLLQEAINRVKFPDIKVDGILGGITFGAANSINPLLLRQHLRECAKNRYLQILEANPDMEWARNGWLTRAKW